MTELLRRLPVRDELDRDGETVVFVGERVILLTPLASAVLAHVGEGATLEQVVDGVVSVFGAPPQGTATDLVRSAVDQLVAEGLLR